MTSLFNIANLMTILRIILAGVFVCLIRRPGVGSTLLATMLFILAALTDYYDGYFAKKYNLVSNFGKIMDPIADKFLILAAFFVFVQMGLVAGWMFFLIFLRESILTGFRLVAITKGQVLAAEIAGKRKTVLQISTILVILVCLIIKRVDPFDSWDPYPRQNFYNFSDGVVLFLMWAVVGITLYSGGQYLWNNRKVFFNSKV